MSKIILVKRLSSSGYSGHELGRTLKPISSSGDEHWMPVYGLDDSHRPNGIDLGPWHKGWSKSSTTISARTRKGENMPLRELFHLDKEKDADWKRTTRSLSRQNFYVLLDYAHEWWTNACYRDEDPEFCALDPADRFAPLLKSKWLSALVQTLDPIQAHEARLSVQPGSDTIILTNLEFFELNDMARLRQPRIGVPLDVVPSCEIGFVDSFDNLSIANLIPTCDYEIQKDEKGEDEREKKEQEKRKREERERKEQLARNRDEQEAREEAERQRQLREFEAREREEAEELEKLEREKRERKARNPRPRSRPCSRPRSRSRDDFYSPPRRTYRDRYDYDSRPHSPPPRQGKYERQGYESRCRSPRRSPPRGYDSRREMPTRDSSPERSRVRRPEYEYDEPRYSQQYPENACDSRISEPRSRLREHEGSRRREYARSRPRPYGSRDEDFEHYRSSGYR